ADLLLGLRQVAEDAESCAGPWGARRLGAGHHPARRIPELGVVAVGPIDDIESRRVLAPLRQRDRSAVARACVGCGPADVRAQEPVAREGCAAFLADRDYVGRP